MAGTKLPAVPNVTEQAKHLADLHRATAQAQAQIQQANAELTGAKLQAAAGMQQAEVDALMASIEADIANREKREKESAKAAGRAPKPVEMPEIAPLPTLANPEVGGTNLGFGNFGDTLAENPGGVAGGAAVQAASGGAGRALPPATPSGAPQGRGGGQFQAPATRTTTQVREGTERAILPGFIANMPSRQTITTMEPNTLTAYEAGRLQQIEAKNQIDAYAKNVGALKGAEDALANAMFARENDGMTAEEFNQAVPNILSSVAPELRPRVWSSALGKSRTKEIDDYQSLVKAQDDLTILAYRDRFPKGSPEWQDANRSYESIIAGRTQMKYQFASLNSPTMARITNDFLNNAGYSGTLNTILQAMDSRPDQFGADGKFSSGISDAIGVSKAIIGALGPARFRQMIEDSQRELENAPLGAETSEQLTQVQQAKAEALARLRKWNDPEGAGAVDALQQAIDIGKARSTTTEVTVRALTAFRGALDLRGWEDAARTRSALQTELLQNDRYRMAIEGRAEGMERIGVGFQLPRKTAEGLRRPFGVPGINRAVETEPKTIRMTPEQLGLKAVGK